MSPRAKKRTRKPRRWGRILLALAIVGGGATGALQMTRSSLFGLARIDVVGARSLSRADVIAASGLRPGQNALAIDLPAVAARVRGLAGVASAVVQREGSLAIRIAIVERAPAVEVASGAQRWWFDQSGAPLALAKPPRIHVPVIEVPGVASASPRDPQGAPTAVDALTIAGPTVSSVLQLWAAAPASFRSRVGRFTAQPDGSLLFTLDGAEISFGLPTQIAGKLEAIDLVETAVHRDRGHLYALDVTAPGHPAARLSG